MSQEVSQDPLETAKFRVKWDGTYIPGVSRVSALRRTTEVVEHRDGGDPTVSRKAPGRTVYEAITLQRGVTEDSAFEDWANLVFEVQTGVESGNFRKDVYLELYNEAGQLARAYKIYRCWPSAYDALPDLDGGGNAIAIEQIRLENEGWERDVAVVEPG